MKDGEEAIDNYLVWELCKKKGIREEMIEGRQKEDDLEEKVEETKKRVPGGELQFAGEKGLAERA